VLLQQHHPDKVEGAKQQEALRITQLIRESYDVLSDPIKRAEHDSWIKEQESGKDEFKYNEKQSYQKQDDNPSSQVPIENNSGCFWIIGLVVFCFWIFSGDDKPPIVEATEVKQEQFIAPPLSKSYEAVQEKIVSPPPPKTDIELLNSAKELLKQKQFESALTIYRNLAESDNLAVQAEAQNELGVRYSEGIGVTQSYSIAMLWFQKSANQKYAGAEYNLGWLYEKGLGVQKDYAMAVFWYQKATDHGYSTEHSKNALIHLNLPNDNPSIVEDSEKLSVTEKTTSVEQSELRQLSQNWIIAHLSKDIVAFSGLYDDFVLFYGTKMNRNSTLEAKLKLFKKYPDLQQQIYGDIQFEKQTDGTIKSSFIKRVQVTITQKTTDYPAYLIFKKSNNGWKITVESDLVTDKNIAKKSNSSNGVDIPKNAIRGDFNGDEKGSYVSESKVSLVGTVITASAPANETVDGEVHQYPALKLKKAIDVNCESDDEFCVSKQNMSVFQLAMNTEQYEQYEDKKLRGKTVTVDGQLYPRDNGHHFTPFLILVKSIK
jgi:ketosteroid isomerase-like protein